MKAVKNTSNLLSYFSIYELTFIGVTSVLFGASFWGWTFFDVLLKPFLQTFGLHFLTAGVWLLPGVFAPFIIRKPGVALLASLLAACVEAMFSSWGITAVLWGLAQGLGAELVFAVLRYRYWHSRVLYCASVSSALCSYALSYFHSGYYLLSISFNVLQLCCIVVSALLLCGFFCSVLVAKLLPTGLLDSFAIAKDRG